MLDLSEFGRQIGEKLFVLLDTEQQKELIHYVLARNKQNSSDTSDLPFVLNASELQSDHAKPLTEIREGDLYFCLEERTAKCSIKRVPVTKRVRALFLWQWELEQQVGDCIDKVVVDYGGKIVVEWSIEDSLL